MKTTGIVSGKSPENPVRDLTPVRAAFPEIGHHLPSKT